jgi:hypothetical protein
MADSTNDIRIEIDPTEGDLYANFMPLISLNTPSLNNLPEKFRHPFDSFLKI